MTNLEDRIAALEAKLARLEDERAVQAHLVRYGLAVDSGDEAACISLFAKDCSIDIDQVVFMDGREEARQIVASDAHQALLPNCAHVMGPFVVELEGDRAVATGYATVFLRSDGQNRVLRQSFGRWEMAKQDGQWSITRRISRGVGRTDTGEVLQGGLHPAVPGPVAGERSESGSSRPDWSW